MTTKTGNLLGTGAALSVSIGFIPDHVELTNVTDGDTISFAFPREKWFAFTSGGTTEIKAGDTLVGASTGFVMKVKQIEKASGTWAGGDAAGKLAVDLEDIIGTPAAENAYKRGGGGTNDITLSDAGLQSTVNVIGTAGPAVTTVASAGIIGYAGSTSAGNGFTIGAGLSESGDRLFYKAVRTEA